MRENDEETFAGKNSPGRMQFVPESLSVESFDSLDSPEQFLPENLSIKNQKSKGRRASVLTSTFRKLHAAL